MEQLAPPWAAAEWDNVGLLAGDPSWPAKRILLTIDLTGPVLDEAVRGKADVILAYHPPLFRPVKRLLPDRSTPAGLAAEALARRIAVYSPHTALDTAIGGTNDTLAELAGLRDLMPFDAAAGGEPQCKLVVFVPAAEVDALADAVFEAGAGRIGEYQKCSYRLRGQGTFFGTEATDPTIGRKGRLERVEEIRLEVIFPKRRLAAVTAAVRRAHSYDQPAFDIYPLEPLPEGRIGQGRIGGFDRAVTLATLARRLAKQTAAANVLTVGKRGGKLTRGLVCVGAAGALPFEIAGRPCGPGDVVITGEIRHHDALRYDRCGVAAVALGHWASERPVLAPLAAMLRKLLPGLTATISRADRDPFRSP
jgi:dinuclear metal center YbgI/SA1388 family protein